MRPECRGGGGGIENTPLTIVCSDATAPPSIAGNGLLKTLTPLLVGDFPTRCT